MSRVLIIGSGGREHALGWKLAQSPLVTEVWYAPGNAGTEEGKGHNLVLNANRPQDWPAFVTLIREKQIVLTVVGPEAPLHAGFVDMLVAQGIDGVFGPSRAAAQLEADKFFSYQLMHRLHIPQAKSVCCRCEEEIRQAIVGLSQEQGVVLKARGLAAGKGVVVCDSQEQALQAFPSLIAVYGPDILVAERLIGPEFSLFAVVAEGCVFPMSAAFYDYKRLYDGDLGPNTGSMGAYGPINLLSAAQIRQISDTMLTPVVRELERQGVNYRGFLYAGMMMTPHGPRILEFNVRFGDPECQVVMMLLESDLFATLMQTWQGQLQPDMLALRKGAACCVVLAAPGYPDEPVFGLPLVGLESVETASDTKIFHAGTVRHQSMIRSAGGRVLGVTAYDMSGLSEARNRVYQAISQWRGADLFHYRKDIAEVCDLKRGIDEE